MIRPGQRVAVELSDGDTLYGHAVHLRHRATGRWITVRDDRGFDAAFPEQQVRLP
jgi:hypothetical protein